MTNAQKFVEVFGTDPKRQYSTKTWWEQEFESNNTDVLDKIRVEISKSKTEHEMQLAENDIKGKLIVSDIYCDIVNIIDKYKVESEE